MQPAPSSPLTALPQFTQPAGVGSWILILASVVLCPPIGLAALWWSTHFALLPKVAITAPIAALMLLGLVVKVRECGSEHVATPVPLPATPARRPAATASAWQVPDLSKEVSVSVSADQLVADYADNQVRADQTHRGKLVTVSGTVARDLEGRPFAMLVTSSERTVQCRFRASETRAASLHQGQQVQLRGTVLGVGPIDGSLLVEECEVRS